MGSLTAQASFYLPSILLFMLSLKKMFLFAINCIASMIKIKISFSWLMDGAVLKTKANNLG